MGVPIAAGYGAMKANESANQPGGKKNAPAPPDYMGLAKQQAGDNQALLAQQTRANRPNQSNPYASQTWTEGPNGQWSQSTQFSGPMADANAALQQQAAQSMGSPLDFSGLPAMTDGAAARDQAISAAYGQATSRLDPSFGQREEALRSRLVNQGLQPGSEAYNRELALFGQERNDAYGSAMNSAIGQGAAAGNMLFNQGLAGRQQAMSELLRRRGQPMAELQAMNGLTGMSGFSGAGLGQGANLLGAGGMQYGANLNKWQMDNQALADMYGGGMQLLGTAASVAPFFLSDERAKTEVQRTGEDVLPGVPAVTFRYRPEFGLGEALHVGVSAQDLQRAYPEAVRERPDGLLEVHPAFAPHPLE